MKSPRRIFINLFINIIPTWGVFLGSVELIDLNNSYFLLRIPRSTYQYAPGVDCAKSNADPID